MAIDGQQYAWLMQRLSYAVISLVAGMSIVELQRWLQRRSLSQSLLATSLHVSNNVQVCIGSTSSLKREAVERIVFSTFPGAQIITIAAESGVPEQPVGHATTLAGAEARLAQAVSHLNKENGDSMTIGFAVGIENGVVELVEGKWVDMAFVVLQDCNSGRKTFATSAGVPIEASVVRAALEGDNDVEEEGKGHTNKLKTIGDVIAARAGAGASSVDPHALLTGGLVGRRQLLQQAFAIAWGSMQS